MAPDVFDYGDFKSENWHRAKKIREVFMVTNPLAHFIPKWKIVFVLAAALNNNKNNLQTVEAEKNFLNYA